MNASSRASMTRQLKEAQNSGAHAHDDAKSFIDTSTKIVYAFLQFIVVKQK